MRTLSDEGYLSHKEDLPVMELRFGDTGAPGDSKWGEHSLGPLVCQGDAIFDNIVTFRSAVFYARSLSEARASRNNKFFSYFCLWTFMKCALL